jgi:hypothetical protein
MKKIIYLLLTGAIFLSACSAKEDMTNPKTQPIPEENSIIENEEETTTTEVAITTAVVEEENSEVDVIETDNVYEYFGVPNPFPEEICFVDDNKYFYDIYETKFGANSGNFSLQVAESLGEEENSMLERYHNNYGGNNKLGMKNDTMEVTINLYTFFKGYDIPKEEIINLLTEYNNMNIGFAEKFNDTTFLDRNYTEEEIEAIANLDKDALNELFVSDYCIIKDRSIYTPEWLYCHSLEDYVVAGISPDDVKSRISLYQELPYSVEGAEFFGEKLSEFTGETVIFDDWETKLAEN